MSCRACVITSPAGSSEVSFAPGAIVRHAPAPPHAIAPVDRARLGVRSVDCASLQATPEIWNAVLAA
jgi:hypothetical protein